MQTKLLIILLCLCVTASCFNYANHYQRSVQQAPSASPQPGSTFHYDRLTQDNTVILLVDHQTGLLNGVKDSKILDFWRNSLLALAGIVKVFNLPVIVSTSRSDGPNGPYFPPLFSITGNVTLISRPGEINAWDNPDFQAAVKATGRTKVIVSGIVTEVCQTFLALSLRDAGYDVYAAVDSSGTYHPLVEQMGIVRMVQAGVVPMTWFAIACELQVDWRRPTGEDFANLVKTYLPWYSNLIYSWESVTGRKA
jgi:nicotinamidase-related amidase